MKIVTGTEMQKLDRRTIIEAHVPSTVLMERAGEGIVRHLEEHCGPVRGRTITILCGKGNNGGDGLVVALLQDGGIPVSLFIEPDLAQVKASHRVSADFVELHTGRYANARRSKEADAEVEAITQAAKLSYELGMGVNAGHGLDYRNLTRLTHIPEIVEYNIGHSIIARAVLVGLDQAVREMKALLS